MTLTADDLARVLGDRPLRVFPALLATDAEAQAWARDGGPAGAVVTSDYQAAPRGRSGITWEVDAERDLVASLIVRPDLTDEREGWLYTAALVGLAEAVGRGTTVMWPDDVRRDGATVASLGWHVELGPGRVDWAVLTVWVRDVEDRAETLARVVAAVEGRLGDDPARVLAVARPRCDTLGLDVRAHLIPMGPAGPRIRGEAADLLDDGALMIHTPAGGRIPVTPQGLGELELLDPDAPDPTLGYPGMGH